MAFPEATYVETNDITLAVYTAGPKPGSVDKPTVVMMHGFPELAYSWRHQLKALGEAGYPVLAPDMRGYGNSDVPDGVPAYTAKELAADMAGVLDHYGLEKAVFLGHDWGALLLWQLPFYMPERLLACGGLSVPFIPNYPMDPIELFKMAFGDNMYMVQFQEPERCDKILAEDVERTVRFFIRRPKERTSVKEHFPAKTRKNLDLIEMLQHVDEENWFGDFFLDEKDFRVYVNAFKKTGYSGGINWYRNFTSNWEAMKEFQTPDNPPRITVPSLIITSDRDAACPPHLADGMENFCDIYERHDLKDTGHWLMQERPAEINQILLTWLAKHF